MHEALHRHHKPPFPDKPRHERPFRRGDFKYIILHCLKDKSSYGYEIMRALQERFNSFYVPSPGSVYPTLQMLEEMGHVTASEQDGKKVYTITGSGRRFLEEKKEFEERMRGRMKNWCNLENRDDIGKTMHEFHRLTHLLKKSMRTADVEKIGRIHKTLTRACEEIEKDRA